MSIRSLRSEDRPLRLLLGDNEYTVVKPELGYLHASAYINWEAFSSFFSLMNCSLSDWLDFGFRSIFDKSLDPQKLSKQSSIRSDLGILAPCNFELLNKCHADEPLAVPLDGLNLDDKLHFVEEPVEIVDREVKRLKRSRIPLVKVRWNSKRGPEYTWEREDQFKKKYPQLFTKTTPSSSVAL
ncbi:hypothetical protein Tco_0558635 [Tanacetum coccineum]